MINILKIKNFALLKDVEISFKKGFNVLIGASGAGKSLVFKALGFALGEKPNKLMIRQGEQKVSVTLVCDSNSTIKEIFDKNNIDYNDSIIIQRTYSIDGKSDIRINGNIVTLAFLKEIACNFVEFYAQNENIELSTEKNHIKILDLFIGNKIQEIIEKIGENNLKLFEIDKKLKNFGSDDASREREIDLLNYQINEISSFGLQVGEDEEIKNKLTEMQNYEKINRISSDIIDKLNNICNFELACTNKNFSLLSSFNKSIIPLEKRAESVYYELCDIKETFQEYSESVVFDEGEYNKLDLRLNQIKNLKKKYGPTIEDVLNFLKNAQNRIKVLQDSSNLVEELLTQRKTIAKKQYELCIEISNLRRFKAKEFEAKVIDELADIGILSAQFKINFANLKEFSEDMNFSCFGLDDVEFLFSANVGQSTKSLSKIASGGEMSRLMLAIKNVVCKKINSLCFVFDEIDTGISGKIGFLVAKKIANISTFNQVICITHLPQVTAMADNYILIEKKEENNISYSISKTIENNEIISYIASLFGTDKVTEISRQNAKEIKNISDEYKKTLLNS